MKWTTEAKVGVFTLMGLLLFAMAVAFLSRVSIFEPPQMHIRGEFMTVTGLKPGNAVKFSGVDVGKIKALSVNGKGASVEMSLNADTKIPKDSIFTLASDGIIGDKFLQIIPGTSQIMLKEGDVVYGEGRSEMEKGFDSANEVMKEANKSLKAINNIIGDEQTQLSLRNALRSSEEIMSNTAAMTANMNALIAQNSGNINALTANMVTITRNMDALTGQLNASMATLDGDQATSTNMRNIIANMKTTTDSVNKMAKSLEGVVTDPQSAADIRTTLHNTANLTTKLNQLTGGGLGIKGEANVEMLYNGTKDEYSPNFNMRLFTGKNMTELGATHIGDGTNLELNYGKFVTNKFLLRAGLFDGDVGLGVDYGIGGPYSFSAAIMDPNHRRYRLRSELRVYRDWYGVAQIIRPTSADNGGTYFGIKKNF